MRELSKSSTVPANFDQILDSYTQKGYRVLGLAWRPIDMKFSEIQVATRDQVEKELTFLGFLVM